MRSAISLAACTALGPCEHAMRTKLSAIASAKVRPVESSSTTCASRLRSASLNNLLLGRPPGFPLEPFFHLFGFNTRIEHEAPPRGSLSNALTVARQCVSKCWGHRKGKSNGSGRGHPQITRCGCFKRGEGSQCRARSDFERDGNFSPFDCGVTKTHDSRSIAKF